MASAARTPEVLTRAATFVPATFNRDAGTVELVWSTGARVERRDFWTGKRYNEELSLEPGHVDLTRLNAGAPLLNAHASRDLADIVGVVERAWIAKGEGRAKVRFSPRADVAPIIADVEAGIIRNVSVGYSVRKYEITEGDTPTYRAVDWQPMELSLVPIPADAAAQVRSHEGTTMSETTANTPDPVTVERARVTEILALGTRHSIDVRELVASGATVGRARTQILETLAARDLEGTRPATGSGLMWGTDHAAEAVNGRLELMTEALCARHGGPAPSERARPYVGARLVDMARELLELRGVSTTRYSPSELITRALATSDLPNLLTGTGNRSLRQAYESYPAGVRRIARQSTIRDFRAKSALALSEAPTLQKVNEHGEFTVGSLAEMKSTYSLGTYGRIVALTRQAMINDDLGAFADLLRRFGIAAAEFESQTLVALLTGNPTMTDDSTALFHANHGNLAGSGAAIGDAPLTAGRLAMRTQKGIDKTTPINVTPRFLIVPAAIENAALKYVAAIAPATAATVNPFAGALEVVVDPRLDAASATAWYLAADPMQVDTIEYSYLESEQGPMLETRVGFEVDGLEIKCRLDYGAGVLDWRGLFKNPGA